VVVLWETERGNDRAQGADTDTLTTNKSVLPSITFLVNVLPPQKFPQNLPPTTMTEETKDAVVRNKIPVDRDWLRKLLQRYHGDDYNEPAYVLAPMVENSDLPFRLLCRRYGANLCFTPMIHSKLFVTSSNYRQKFTLHHIPASDRPLIAQICGNDVETMLQCVKLLEPYCDGIDINCGWYVFLLFYSY